MRGSLHAFQIPNSKFLISNCPLPRIYPDASNLKKKNGRARARPCRATRYQLPAAEGAETEAAGQSEAAEELVQRQLACCFRKTPRRSSVGLSVVGRRGRLGAAGADGAVPIGHAAARGCRLRGRC